MVMYLLNSSKCKSNMKHTIVTLSRNLAKQDNILLKKLKDDTLILDLCDIRSQSRNVPYSLLYVFIGNILTIFVFL